jgi:hypothetical protein
VVSVCKSLLWPHSGRQSKELPSFPMGDVPSMLPVPMARPRGSGDISNLVVVVVVMVVWMVVNILLPEGGSSRVPAKSRSICSPQVPGTPPSLCCVPWETSGQPVCFGTVYLECMAEDESEAEPWWILCQFSVWKVIKTAVNIYTPQGEVRLFIEVVKIKPIVMRPRSANSWTDLRSHSGAPCEKILIVFPYFISVQKSLRMQKIN